MKILVCGGAGYIGSHCVRELKDVGFDCVIYDNLTEGNRSAVEGFTFVEGDLLDAARLDRVFAEHKIDGVINFAALALVGESMKNPILYYENNLCGMVNLLKAMQKAGVNKIVFSSTCAVYGETTVTPITEETPTNPCNPYGETKLAVEQFLAWCATAYGIKSVCLRYFNAAGAMPDGSIGESRNVETHLIPLIFRSILTDYKLRVFGDDYPTRDGSCIRDYIHVLDLADAHIRAMRRLLDGGDSAVYNLGSGVGISVLEMIRAAQTVTGRTVNCEVAERRPGDPAVLVASYDKARRELGWEPRRSGVEEILRDAWAFARK